MKSVPMAVDSTKEHPILFAAPMILAILSGRKFQTRRIVSRSNSLVDGWGAPKALWESLDFSKAWIDPGPSTAGNSGPYLKVPCPARDTVHRVYSRKQKADRLWVKENFRLRADQDSKKPSEDWWKSGGWYEADGLNAQPSGCAGGAGKLRPSIFMPRWASRITLEITAVKPERAQDISAEDAIAEGIDRAPHQCGCEFCSRTSQMCPATASGIIGDFAALWSSINGRESWDESPWCWAYGFKRICQCASEIEDPQPHLDTCPWSDPNYDDGVGMP